MCTLKTIKGGLAEQFLFSNCPLKNAHFPKNRRRSYLEYNFKQLWQTSTACVDWSQSDVERQEWEIHSLFEDERCAL